MILECTESIVLLAKSLSLLEGFAIVYPSGRVHRGRRDAVLIGGLLDKGYGKDVRGSYRREGFQFLGSNSAIWLAG